jgi:pyruvate/2-oxoglutarate dehydrogenase complex dihydrolipoamide acyltransferase (E2) component
MKPTEKIAAQFAAMLQAANHPSPAVRRIAHEMARNIAQMNRLYNRNAILAAATLKKMRKN